VYLDVAQLAPNAYGVEAGARRWFQRPAKDLSPRQMAELLSLLPCPNTCTPESPLPRSLQPKILANWKAMGAKRGRARRQGEDAP
jgi:membrane peptidoglycan carboxypeptidase